MRKFIIQNTLLKFKILILLVSPSIAFAAVQPLEQVNGGLGGGGGGQIVSDVTIELPDHAQQGDLLENIAVQITSSIRPTRLQITLKSEEEDLAPIEACSVETLTGNGTYNGTCNISLPLLSPSTRYKAEARIEIGAQVEYEKELGDNSSLFLNVNPLNCSRDDYHCISIPENRSPGEAPASLSETIGTSNITSECEDQIKAALSSASPGHTVFIEAGVCQVSQGFKIIKPNLRIVGREGAYRTILEATGTGYLLSIHGDGTKIQGLTLKKGAGIQVSDYIGTLTIQNMRFEDHLGQYDQGGAAINDRGKVGQYLRIIGSHFVENRASGSGAAVALTSPARFSLHDNLFLANLSENGSGGALSVSYSQALKLYSNQFVLNSAHSGGAISVIYSGTVLSRENIFLRNSASN
ncbi:MAG: hypothetical protein KDD42_09275, partial [Bdellovibrionales bacterium]|nr:hypothetical protein [Bdellovibrionales bacterium]